MTGTTTASPDAPQMRTQALHRPWMIANPAAEGDLLLRILGLATRFYAERPDGDGPGWACSPFWFARDGLAGTGLRVDDAEAMPDRAREAIAAAEQARERWVRVSFSSPRVDAWDGPVVDVLLVRASTEVYRANPNFLTHVERCAGLGGRWHLVTLPPGYGLASQAALPVLIYVRNDELVGLVCPIHPRRRP